MTKLALGQLAPDFSLKSLDGRNHSLTSLLAEGPALVSFFKVSCPVCQFTFPFLQRLNGRYSGGGITVVGISQDDARDTKKFNEEFGVKFTTLLDEQPYPVSNAYGLTNVPTTFLIEPDKRIAIVSMGFDKSDLEAIAGELAGKKKLSPTPFFQMNEAVPAFKPG